MGTSFHGVSMGNLVAGLFGQLGVGLSPGDLERWLNGAMEVEHFSQ
jgi:hypothetical protein